MIAWIPHRLDFRQSRFVKGHGNVSRQWNALLQGRYLNEMHVASGNGKLHTATDVLEMKDIRVRHRYGRKHSARKRAFDRGLHIGDVQTEHAIIKRRSLGIRIKCPYSFINTVYHTDKVRHQRIFGILRRKACGRRAVEHLYSVTWNPSDISAINENCL